MALKNACGGGCPGDPTSALDPYQESIQAVWHDPTSYDPNKHAPPYMVRLSSEQKQSARASIQTVNPKVARRLVGTTTPLTSVLAILRAAAFLHQTHHWQTHGPQYYSDHILFERLYNDSQSFIDQVAERAVGSEGESTVEPVQQTTLIGTIVQMVSTGAAPGELVNTSLRVESLVLASINQAAEILKSQGKLSNGTDNLLQGAADLHETFVYLLQQRAKPTVETTAYSYGR